MKRYLSSKNVFYAVLSAIILISIFSFVHPDIFVTTRHSYYLYSKGNFYQNAMNGVLGEKNAKVPAVYELPIYIIFAIWNFPLYVISKLSRHDIFGFYTGDISKSIFIFKILWAKLLVFFFLFFTLKRIYEICLEFGF